MASIWQELGDGGPWALATVVRQLRSAPRDLGTTMAVDAGGRVLGNVSAGCVDAEVHELARRVLADGLPELVTVGVSDDRAWGVGLSCGGAIEIVVRPAPEPRLVTLLAEADAADVPAALVTVLDPEPDRGRHLVLVDGEPPVADSLPEPIGEGLAEAAREAARRVRRDPATHGTGVVTAPAGRFLVQWRLARPLLLLFGAVAFAESLAAAGRLLGYRVVVCDARPLFATPERLPSAHEVVRDWPHRYLERAAVDDRTVVVSLLHDEKFETPLLSAALRGPAAYIGAIGSRATQRRLREALRQAGLGEEHLARLRGPAGLDIGARSSEETAVSILAEVIAEANGRSGRPLSGIATSIHPRRA